MADKENSVRLTRAQAKKRSAASLPVQAPPMASKRKRTALAELPISGNVQPSKPATRLSKKKAAVPVALALPPATKEEEPVQSDLDDPQMCPHYAKDIHQYLRSMEVRDWFCPQVVILMEDLIWVLG